MAVGAQEPQVGFFVVCRVSVDVVDLKRGQRAFRIDLVPAALAAPVFIFLKHISFDMSRKGLSAGADDSVGRAFFPSGNILPVLQISLALIRAIYVLMRAQRHGTIFACLHA